MKTYSFLKAIAALPLCAALAQAQAPHNTLSGEEAASGYQLLFNGTNLTGWRSWNNANSISNAWKVLPDSAGADYNSIQIGTGTVADMITADSSFQNFDFKFEAFVPSAGNSGVFIRYNYYGRAAWGGNSGPELQLAASNNSDGSGTLHRMGTCYDMYPLLSAAANWDKIGPGNNNYGVYQQIRIIAYNNRVAHYGNGIKLLEYDMYSTDYNTKYNASKYKTYPEYRTVHPGGIYLQHHGETGIKFRNLRIKKLTESPWAAGSGYLSNPADTTSGLKSSLTFDNNLFPTAIAPQAREAGQRVSARVLNEGGNYLLLLDRAGDYQVRVDDLRGKSVFSGSVRGANSITLPAAAFAGDTRVVRVLSSEGGSQVFSRLIAPVR